MKEFGVVLDAEEERVGGPFEHFHPTVHAHAVNREAALPEPREVVGVDLVAVSVALPNLRLPVFLGDPRAWGQHHVLGPQAHRSAEVVEHLLLLEKADDRVGVPGSTSEQITAASSLSGNPKPYMNYGDNPLRPILSFWFGPMTMVDFLGNYNLWYTGYGNDAANYCWWPGTCHESPTYACKLGVQAALNDMQNNHPNDFISLIMFSTPLSSASDTGANRFNRVRVGLTQSYSTLSDALWYPPATVGNPTATVTPYTSDNLEVPRAMGGTCYPMGLMLAYNQFSTNSSLLNYNTATYPGVFANDAGGGGRIGAEDRHLRDRRRPEHVRTGQSPG